MKYDEVRSGVKLVEHLLDALGYCDSQTYEIIYNIIVAKLKGLKKSNPKELAYLQACLPQTTDMSSDEVEAWYNAKVKEGSDAGDPAAQYEHACRLWEGTDYIAAVKLYETSAEQGHPKSQYCYGLGLFDGIGIAQNKAKGLHYIELAAGRLYDLALEYLIEFYRDETTPEGQEQFKHYSKMLIWSQNEH